VELAALGARLRAAGLTARSVAAWAGTAHPPALRARLQAGLPTGAGPATSALGLLVGGQAVPIESLRRWSTGEPPLDEMLAAAGIIDVIDAQAHARVALLPLGAALIVCDRIDAVDDREQVPWPDDSSLHLAGAISPRRVTRWLDVGCGSAVAPLLHPRRADELLALDVNPRAVAYARLGAALSGRTELHTEVSDLVAAVPASWRGTTELVTFNAPMIAAGGAGAIWRSTPVDLLAALVAAAPPWLAPGGEVILHGSLPALVHALEPAGGERVLVRYTPASEADGFAVAWWRPQAAPRWSLVERLLRAARPHVEAADRPT